MIWNDFSKAFKDGDHALLSPSTYSWLNYDDEKLIQFYVSRLASVRGTELHALACKLIKMKVRLPDKHNTLNMYVNDAISLGMRTEEKLFYSKFCFGTTDAINYEKSVLHVFDLKTGKNKASFTQLKIYAALFFLCYPSVKLKHTKDIELRIYQNDEVFIEHPGIDDILPIMDKIERYSKVLELLEDEYDEGLSGA